ncbi:uncharacterized protein, partial [Fopius arisanus]|uniref:Uncharacterized protein n=1 Tax=Fopius arisanus TaxID=64838 RepID=A0A9R1U9U9_9HYME
GPKDAKERKGKRSEDRKKERIPAAESDRPAPGPEPMDVGEAPPVLARAATEPLPGTGLTTPPPPTLVAERPLTPGGSLELLLEVPKEMAAKIQARAAAADPPSHSSEVIVPLACREVVIPPQGGETVIPPRGGEAVIPPLGGEADHQVKEVEGPTTEVATEDDDVVYVPPSAPSTQETANKDQPQASSGQRFALAPAPRPSKPRSSQRTLRPEGKEYWACLRPFLEDVWRVESRNPGFVSALQTLALLPHQYPANIR